jgi:hypothetical protein
MFHREAEVHEEDTCCESEKREDVDFLVGAYTWLIHTRFYAHEPDRDVPVKYQVSHKSLK